MTQSISPDGEVITMRICGRFDISLYKEFFKALKYTRYPWTRYLIDMRKTEYLHDFGVSMFLLLRSRIGARRNNIITGELNIKKKLVGSAFILLNMCA